MREIKIDELKKRLVELTKELSDICEENNLDMFLSSGTLLGAIRHKGIIPWDDDVDVYMPRPHYDKLIEIMREKNKYSKNKLFCNELNEKYLYPYAKYIDTTTLLIEKGGYAGVEMGLFVDIFPIDGLGNTIESAKKQIRKTGFYTLFIWSLIINPWRKNVSFVKNFTLACLNVVASILGPKYLHKKLSKTVEKIQYNNSKYVGNIVDEINYKNIMLKNEMYEDFELVEFEGYKFKAPKDWEKWLTQIYGDYMTPPPIEKQVLTHGFELYDKEE